MKFSKIFLLFTIIMLIAGCDSEITENPETARNTVPQTESNTSIQNGTPNKSAERLNYTEDTLRLLSGDLSVSTVDTLEEKENNSNIKGETSTPTTPELIDPSLLSSYSTQILTTDENRYNNIKIVADKLNGFILESGKGFSFNDELGPYGKDDGFLEAKILLSNGEESTGYGGGVCQLSTTLYNAVKDLENIEITEHHNHSTPVAYAPKNQDATVSLQSGLNFKFINNYDHPIRFETMHTPNKLTVKVFKCPIGDVR